jgi:ABC-type sugar transport system ATPase subunit
VAENIFLGREPTRNFLLQRNKVFEQCRVDLETMGFDDLDPRAHLSDLTVAQRQMVEIAKALNLDNELIIMDEPTSSLTPAEVDRLFQTMIQLKAQGKAIIFISHRLEEIFKIADYVTVLRDGELVASKAIN